MGTKGGKHDFTIPVSIILLFCTHNWHQDVGRHQARVSITNLIMTRDKQPDLENCSHRYLFSIRKYISQK
jgi:hypothetical protein